MGSMHGLWETALSTLEGRIKPHNFEMWLRPINCKAIDGQRILLSAPSKWSKEWFQDNYQQIVLDALRDQTQQEFEIIFEVRETEGENVVAAVTPTESDAAKEAIPGALPTEKSEPQGTDLLGKYNFDSFVVGP